eukprot:COSAG01_NODE_47132_length_393_cov_0.969388_1_plen_21_part_10
MNIGLNGASFATSARAVAGEA